MEVDVKRTTSRPMLLPAVDQPMTSGTFAHHARLIVLHHGERIMAEIPVTLRRVSLFLLVLAVTIPVFLAGLLVVLWHLGH
jgi:hypothetical protein